ncbi:bifunctional 3-deoxy-7-phosphoheptulonate synthase/chorismate mutase [Cohnella nanjingensis]|uniref:Bifunctional 3-deoxy-7-phosphoheptulonate synthase/chorismate mutase n=1 Tax=Cohnella nanjingensis TaxID=1387779 RepID=A0A7X0RWH2_9BACL|nr:bifunctional 3-deoxy-7-phosphoheptulonate synthase/chorismate mutase [Cohnella nanjingensis]MBB6674942.1 bifunctional 3-deoxy-7-phosphoheptulonate synthase/chorismate mutase [Cohnella nanjingensis]
MSQVGVERNKERLREIDRLLLSLWTERTEVVRETGDDEAFRLRFKQLILDAPEPSAAKKKPLLVSRQSRQADTVIPLGDVAVGGGRPFVVAGPCSVESYAQVRAVAAALKNAGVSVMRGGAFKPRTSPYEFQGLGIEGLRILKEVADEFGLKTISEIVDPAHLELACDYVDVIQIGARNMHNFELLKAAGRVGKPILLKRGLSATIDEFLHAAEYVVSSGNGDVMLIERGIRTYEKATRNTLDISAVPILKQESHLPVLVDVTHSTGRKSIMAPCAKAALAAGADGVMVEVHPEPAKALSDAAQQLDIPEFHRFYEELLGSGLLAAR